MKKCPKLWLYYANLLNFAHSNYSFYFGLAEEVMKCRIQNTNLSICTNTMPHSVFVLLINKERQYTELSK